MAVRSLRFVLTGEDKTASKSLDKLGRKAEGLGSKLGKLSALSGAALGAGAVVFAKQSIQAYSDAEEAQKRLAFAFAKFPKLADTNQGALQKLNSSLQKKTKYDDDAIASGQAVLAQFQLTGKQLTEVTPLLLDYADTTGKELPDAAMDLGKALLGNAKALKNVGIKYQATGDAGKDFTNIQALLNKKVGGFAEHEGKTAAGQVKILKNQFGELQETVGEQLLPVISGLVKWLTDKGVPALQHFADQFKNGTGAGGALRDMLGELKDAAATAADVANKTIVPVIKWFADHPDALKGVVGGMVAFKVATMGAAIWSKSLAIWAPKAAAGAAEVGAASVLATPGVVGLAGALGAALGYYGTLALLGAYDSPSQVKNHLAGTKTAGIDLPKQSPTITFNGREYAASGTPREIGKGSNGSVISVSPRNQTIALSGRARGGNIEAGRAYMVGERGPEMITPRSAGYVHTAQQTRMMLNPRARLDTSQVQDRRLSPDRLFMTPTTPKNRSAYAPAGMRDYISYHSTAMIFDTKKVGTATTKRVNARVSRGHLPPGLL